ncbi:MAG: Vms1/Ankzf1 family peptidyl-tRNA hydrolase [Mycobacteriales bacterium]
MNDLARIYTADGPFATAYLDISRDSEDAARAIELRWRDSRRELAAGGVDEATLAAMDPVVGERGEPGPAGQVLVGAGGRLLLDVHLPRPPAREWATVAPLPAIGPLLAETPPELPYVLVVVDRVGADITVVGPGGERDRTVTGETWPIQKVHAGGWSERRYQASVEATWEHNAATVAAEVDRAVGEVGAALLVLAGDVRARGLVREHLSGGSQLVLAEVEEGNRAAGADREPLRAAVARLVAERAARPLAEAADRYRQRAGEHRGAAGGLADVVEALSQHRVDTLLLDPDRLAEVPLWAGPAPDQLATEEETLRGLGVEPRWQDRADSVLARAALRTGAVVRAVDAVTLPEHPVAAVVRD